LGKRGQKGSFYGGKIWPIGLWIVQKVRFWGENTINPIFGGFRGFDKKPDFGLENWSFDKNRS